MTPAKQMDRFPPELAFPLMIGCQLAGVIVAAGTSETFTERQFEVRGSATALNRQALIGTLSW